MFVPKPTLQFAGAWKFLQQPATASSLTRLMPRDQLKLHPQGESEPAPVRRIALAWLPRLMSWAPQLLNWL